MRENGGHQLRLGGFQGLGHGIALYQLGHFRADHVGPQQFAGLGVEDRLDETLGFAERDRLAVADERELADLDLQPLGFGGGLGMLTTPLTVLAFTKIGKNPQFAVGTLLPLLCAGDAFSLWHYWGKWRKANLKFLLPGTIVGIVIGVGYTLRAIQKAFFGEVEAKPATEHDEHHHEMDAISVPERLGAVMLIGVSLLIGLYPKLLMDVIVPSFNSPLFEWLKKGGAQ